MNIPQCFCSVTWIPGEMSRTWSPTIAVSHDLEKWILQLYSFGITDNSFLHIWIWFSCVRTFSKQQAIFEDPSGVPITIDVAPNLVDIKIHMNVDENKRKTQWFKSSLSWNLHNLQSYRHKRRKIQKINRLQTIENQIHVTYTHVTGKNIASPIWINSDISHFCDIDGRNLRVRSQSVSQVTSKFSV